MPSMLDELGRELERKKQERYHAIRTLKMEKEALKQSKLMAKAATKAQLFLQAIAQSVQERAHQQIASVVSRCLCAVFDDPYEFKIDFVQRRGKTEAELKFLQDGYEIDPVEGTGGGVLDLASFALRFACLLLARPKMRPLLVLDEPFKHLSDQYRPRAAALIETLAKEFNVQFLIVTHAEEFQIGKVVKIK